VGEQVQQVQMESEGGSAQSGDVWSVWDEITENVVSEEHYHSDHSEPSQADVITRLRLWG